MGGIGLILFAIGIFMMFVCQEKFGKTVGWVLTMVGCGFIGAV